MNIFNLLISNETRLSMNQYKKLNLYQIIIHNLSCLFIGLFLVLQFMAIRTNAEEIDISDLLIPEPSSINNEAKINQHPNQETKEESNLDELLGPIEIFPFLPDNHRDSGTGKFNAF